MQGRSQPLDATTDGLIEVGGRLTDQNFAGRIEFRIDLTEFSAVGLRRILLGQADRDLSDQFGMPVEPESHASLQIRAKRFHQIHAVAANVNFHVPAPPVYCCSFTVHRSRSERK